jgi:hypothetical protein
MPYYKFSAARALILVSREHFLRISEPDDSFTNTCCISALVVFQRVTKYG